TFVESSWYFLRFCDPRNETAAFDRARAARFMPVDQYIGGGGHALLHPLYARFFPQGLRDLGLGDFGHPFARLLTPGLVVPPRFSCPLHEWVFPTEVEDGKHQGCGRPVRIGRSETMSKSKKNVVDPDLMVARYGADTMRVFMLFASPPEATLDWSEESLEG